MFREEHVICSLIELINATALTFCLINYLKIHPVLLLCIFSCVQVFQRLHHDQEEGTEILREM
jgi:hypothetical protein